MHASRPPCTRLDSEENLPKNYGEGLGSIVSGLTNPQSSTGNRPLSIGE